MVSRGISCVDWGTGWGHNPAETRENEEICLEFRQGNERGADHAVFVQGKGAVDLLAVETNSGEQLRVGSRVEIAIAVVRVADDGEVLVVAREQAFHEVRVVAVNVFPAPFFPHGTAGRVVGARAGTPRDIFAVGEASAQQPAAVALLIQGLDETA